MNPMSNDMALFWAFTSIFVFGMGMTAFAIYSVRHPARRRRRHA